MYKISISYLFPSRHSSQYSFHAKKGVKSAPPPTLFVMLNRVFSRFRFPDSSLLSLLNYWSSSVNLLCRHEILSPEMRDLLSPTWSSAQNTFSMNSSTLQGKYQSLGADRGGWKQSCGAVLFSAAPTLQKFYGSGSGSRLQVNFKRQLRKNYKSQFFFFLKMKKMNDSLAWTDQ